MYYLTFYHLYVKMYIGEYIMLTPFPPNDQLIIKITPDKLVHTFYLEDMTIEYQTKYTHLKIN